MANGNIISGAYSAAGGGVKNYGLAGVKNITDMQTTFSRAVSPYVQSELQKTQQVHRQRKAVFDQYAQEYMSRTGDESADHDAVWNILQKERRNFLYGNKKTRSLVTQKIGKFKAQYNDANNLKNEISQLTFSPDLRGNAWEDFVTSDIGQSIGSILGGQQEATLNEDGVLGWEIEDPIAIQLNQEKANEAKIKYGRLQELHEKLMNQSFLEDNEAKEYDKLAKGDYEKALEGFNNTINKEGSETRFMSVFDIRNLINKNTFDKNSRDNFATTIDFVKKQAEGGEAFDYDDYQFKIKTEIINNGNLHSLIYDTHVPTKGGSFYADLQERLTNGTYEELGITNENVVDPTPKTPITPEDAKIIADELIKDDSVISDYLSTYFANYMQNQYNKFLPSQVDEKEEGDPSVLVNLGDNKGEVTINNEVELTPFEKEFKEQRRLLGPGKTYVSKLDGKSYTTNYVEEVEPGTY